MVFCASGAAAETADMSGLSAGSVNAPAKPTFPPSLAVRCVSGPAMDNFVWNKIEQPQADPRAKGRTPEVSPMRRAASKYQGFKEYGPESAKLGSARRQGDKFPWEAAGIDVKKCCFCQLRC